MQTWLLGNVVIWQVCIVWAHRGPDPHDKQWRRDGHCCSVIQMLDVIHCGSGTIFRPLQKIQSRTGQGVASGPVSGTAVI